MGLWSTFATWSVVMLGLLAVGSKGYFPEVTLESMAFYPVARNVNETVEVEDLEFTIPTATATISLNGMVVIKKEIRQMVLEMEVGRCLGDERESCQHVFAMNYTNVCDQMGKKNQIWSTVVNSIEGLPKKCPIPPGRYEMIEAYPDIKKSLALTILPPGTWKATLRFYDEKGPIICIRGIWKM